MEKENYETINFEKLLDRLTYKEKHEFRSEGQHIKDGITRHEYDTFYYYVDEYSHNYKVGERTYREANCSPTLTKINQRKEAVGNLQYFLVRKIFLEKIKKTSMFDKEKIKMLKAKEQELLACDKKLYGDDYLKFVSHEEMVKLIKKAEKRSARLKAQEEKQERRQERRQERQEAAAKNKEAGKRVKKALADPIINAVHSTIKTIKDKKNLGKDL